MSAVTKPTRPLLRYFGGKWQLRHWIIEHLPPHTFYAEPFAGAASVLLAKTPARGGEILNDLNKNVINLFRVMQNDKLADALKRKLSWTPYANAELVLSRKPSKDPVESARRLLIRSFMGIEVAGTCGTASGFRMGNVDLCRMDRGGKRTFRNCATDWDNWRDGMEAIRERLSKVMIYEKDALEFIALMSTPKCLLYIDPPYVIETRSRAHGGSRYAVEFDRHKELLEAAISSKAMIVISGYPHPSYAVLEQNGWKRVDKDYRANMSLERRTECLWINQSAQQNRSNSQQSGLSL